MLLMGLERVMVLLFLLLMKLLVENRLILVILSLVEVIEFW